MRAVILLLPLTFLLVPGCTIALFAPDAPSAFDPLTSFGQVHSPRVVPVRDYLSARGRQLLAGGSPTPNSEQSVLVLIPQSPQRIIAVGDDTHLDAVLEQVLDADRKASVTRVGVFRRCHVTGRDVLIQCDTEGLWRYGDLCQDLALYPGDIVFVPVRGETLEDEFFALPDRTVRQ